MGGIGNGAGVSCTSDNQGLQSWPQGSNHRRYLGLHLEVDPVVHLDTQVGLEVNLPAAKQQQVDGRHHGHPLAGDGPRPQLLVEHEEGDGEVDDLPGAVDAGLVDQGNLGLRGVHLPLLTVHAHVGVQSHGQQGHHHVKVGVRTVEVVFPRYETLFRKSTIDQDVSQLVLGLPHHPQTGHVEALLVAEVDLAHLSHLPGILPTGKCIERGNVVRVPVGGKALLPVGQLPVHHVRHEDLGPGGAARGDGGEGVTGREHGSQDHHLAKSWLHWQSCQNSAQLGQLIITVNGQHFSQ